jgi:glycogen synthase
VGRVFAASGFVAGQLINGQGKFFMHIVLVTPAYPPLPGGGERYVDALAIGLIHQGFRVTVITSAAVTEADFWTGSTNELESENGPEGLRIIRCPVRAFPGGRRGLMLWRKAMVVLSALPGDQSAILSRMAGWIPPIDGLRNALAGVAGIDIIHAFNISWEHGLVVADTIARQSGLPLMTTPFAHLGTGRDDPVARNSTMDHQLAILRRSARVLVLTDVERVELAAYGIPIDRIAVIGGGVDPPPPNAHPAGSPDPTWPEKYGVFIGRLSRDKGAIDAAKAVIMARSRGSDITLLMAGSITPEFERYHNRLDPADRAAIHLLGIVLDQQKHRLLSGAAFLTLPSRSDSFGIVLLEAWSYGVPVIAARAGGIPGVVDEGENGLLVPYGDVAALAGAIERLLDNPDLARRLGENGQTKVEQHYNWDKVTQRALEQYMAILDER